MAEPRADVDLPRRNSDVQCARLTRYERWMAIITNAAREAVDAAARFTRVSSDKGEAFARESRNWSLLSQDDGCSEQRYFDASGT